MPTRPCPECHSTALRFLPASSSHAIVNYHRCDNCGDVFTVPKEAPDAPTKPITTKATTS